MRVLTRGYYGVDSDEESAEIPMTGQSQHVQKRLRPSQEGKEALTDQSAKSNQVYHSKHHVKSETCPKRSMLNDLAHKGKPQQ